MKSKEIYNLFGEMLSDEIESRVVKNKTLTFKKEIQSNQRVSLYTDQEYQTSERNQTISK